MITRAESPNDLQPLSLSGRLARLEEPPAAAYNRVRDAIDRERAHPGRVSAVALALWLALGTLGALEVDALWRMRTLLRADLNGVLGVCVVSVGLAAMLALGASQLALSRGSSGLGVSVPVLRGIAIGVPVLNLIPQLLLVFFASRQHVWAATRAQVHAWGVPCFVLSMVLAGFFLTLFARQLRGSVVAGAGWRSAALGAAAGAWSGVALIVHCAGVDAVHLLLGHGLPALLFPLVGLAVVRRHVQI